MVLMNWSEVMLLSHVSLTINMRGSLTLLSCFLVESFWSLGNLLPTGQMLFWYFGRYVDASEVHAPLAFGLNKLSLFWARFVPQFSPPPPSICSGGVSLSWVCVGGFRKCLALLFGQSNFKGGLLAQGFLSMLGTLWTTFQFRGPLDSWHRASLLPSSATLFLPLLQPCAL